MFQGSRVDAGTMWQDLFASCFRETGGGIIKQPLQDPAVIRLRIAGGYPQQTNSPPSVIKHSGLKAPSRFIRLRGL